MMAMRHVITMEEGFQILQKGITKLFNIVEGLEPNFTAEERLTLYTYVSISQNNNHFDFYFFIFIVLSH
jgi:hypothetical protein